MLLSKAPSPVEVYNDLDDRLYRIFSVVRDRSQARQLLRQLLLTTYSEREFSKAWQSPMPDDPIEAARICIVRLRMAFGGAGSRGNKPGFGFGKTSNQAKQFSNFRKNILALSERLSSVTVMCRPAVEVVQIFDSPDTLVYCDPPYVPSSRRCARDYLYEMTVAQHGELADTLLSAKSKVIVSGYDSPEYNSWFRDWNVHSRKVSLRVARVKNQTRTEFVWTNF